MPLPVLKTLTFDATQTATDMVTMQFRSCLTYFLNQDTTDTLEYCRTDWVSAIT